MSNKYIKLENLNYYDSKIKEYISNNIGDGSGIEIYDDFSQLPTDLTEKTIAYCENDYVDTTSTTTYDKGLYFYNINNSTWELITINVDVDLSELEEALNKIDNMVTQNDLKDYLDKDTYMSEVNEGNVKSADKSDKISGVELSQPEQYYGKNKLGEVGFHYFPIAPTTVPETEQRYISPAIANNVYVIDSQIDLTESKLYIQCLKEVEGNQNVVLFVNDFNNENSDSIYYNQDVITFEDDNIHIKNNYSIKTNTVENDYFISEIINVNEFIL